MNLTVNIWKKYLIASINVQQTFFLIRFKKKKKFKRIFNFLEKEFLSYKKKDFYKLLRKFLIRGN